MRAYTMFITLFCLSLQSCQNLQRREIPEPIVVSRAAVTSDTIAISESFISSLSPNYIAIVQPRINGFLTAKRFSNGMPVKRGDVIFRIDSRKQSADLLSANANLESAKANAVEAKNNYSRAIPLAEIDAISQAQLDQYTAEYNAAVARVKSAEQSVKNARLELDYTTICASIDGIISSSEAFVGDYVGPGTKFATLTRIENIDTLCAEVAIPVAQYLNITGRKSFTYNNKELLSNIELYLADGTLYPYKGSYSYTKSAVAATEGTIIIVVTFPNPNYLLKSGQFARVKSNLGAPQPMLTVPQSAVNDIQGVQSVWVIKPDSTVEYRPVTLGVSYAGRQVLRSGVKVGESVVSHGGAKLSNGQKVKVL